MLFGHWPGIPDNPAGGRQDCSIYRPIWPSLSPWGQVAGRPLPTTASASAALPAFLGSPLLGLFSCRLASDSCAAQSAHGSCHVKEMGSLCGEAELIMSLHVAGFGCGCGSEKCRRARKMLLGCSRRRRATCLGGRVYDATWLSSLPL